MTIRSWAEKNWEEKTQCLHTGHPETPNTQRPLEPGTSRSPHANARHLKMKGIDDYWCCISQEVLTLSQKCRRYMMSKPKSRMRRESISSTQYSTGLSGTPSNMRGHLNTVSALLVTRQSSCLSLCTHRVVRARYITNDPIFNKNINTVWTEKRFCYIIMGCWAGG